MTVTLYSTDTPNGVLPYIFLKELKEAYGFSDWKWVTMDIKPGNETKVENHVKNDWYVKINPNSRIPALVHDDFVVVETSAILVYLADTFDKERKFSFDPKTHPKEYSEQTQWLFFFHGGLNVIGREAIYIGKILPLREPQATDRVVGQTNAFYNVLNVRLADRDYIVGPGKGTYSIVDILPFAWVQKAAASGVDIEKYPNIKAWSARVGARPNIIAGLEEPKSL